MGIVRFALRFPYTFYILAALIVFLGGTAIIVMPKDIFPEPLAKFSERGEFLRSTQGWLAEAQVSACLNFVTRSI